MLSELHHVKDLIPEGERCDEASEEELDEESNSNVLVEATLPLCLDQTVFSHFI